MGVRAAMHHFDQIDREMSVSALFDQCFDVSAIAGGITGAGKLREAGGASYRQLFAMPCGSPVSGVRVNCQSKMFS